MESKERGLAVRCVEETQKETKKRGGKKRGRRRRNDEDGKARKERAKKMGDRRGKPTGAFLF